MNYTKTQKRTWKDFSMKEHLRAFLEIEPFETIDIRKLWGNLYRVNVRNNELEIVDSNHMEIIKTSEGYIMKLRRSESCVN